MPATAEDPTAKVTVDVPAPVIEAGLKATVTPVGWPVAVNAMPELKPFVTVLVIVDVPEPPCTTESAVVEAFRPKLGVLITLNSPLIKPLPFGLPQPVAKSYPVVAE